MNLKDYLNKEVVLKSGEVAKCIGIKENKGLITVRIGDGKKTDRYPENVSLRNSQVKIDGGTIHITGDEPDETTVTITPPRKYSINQKFDFMAKLVRMVLLKIQESVVITGEGGLGKTYTVQQELDNAGLVKGTDYHVVKGYTTAKGLYRTLYEQNGKIIMFDDCDEALKNEVAKNILKGALDSFGERIISWVTNSIDDSLPDEFEFTGNIIFISNMPQDKVDQALRSRSFTVDLSMSVDDKIERMRNISRKVEPRMKQEDKDAVMDFIEAHKYQCADLNMRTLLKGLKIFKAYPDVEEWQGMLQFTLINDN